jgi:2-polyprenyl-3-methyl-5-hydroxy-6-metoxy-1,4-benzoquinol methylase
LVCEKCWLVQAEDYSRASELFNEEYAYFSSFVDSWVRHAENLVALATNRFGLDSTSFVVEVASNDGYLLQHVRSRGIPCLGIEPTASTANAARQRGIETIEKFFGVKLAQELASQGRTADLTVGINVLAHVPDINDFVSGIVTLLKPNGVSVFEFPHLLSMITERQFDTIYHEHFSYLSFTTVCEIFRLSGLEVFDVEVLGTHGGSLRVYSQRVDTGRRTVSPAVQSMRSLEARHGLHSREFYQGFAKDVEGVKAEFLHELVAAKRLGKRVAGYGAAAKGNTLLNYAGVKTDLIEFVADRSTAKQGKWLPGSRIPIVGEQYLREAKPDLIVLLPWNLRHELLTQLAYAREWGATFLVTQPSVEIIS